MLYPRSVFLGRERWEEEWFIFSPPMDLWVEQAPFISAEGMGRRKIPGTQGVCV